MSRKKEAAAAGGGRKGSESVSLLLGLHQHGEIANSVQLFLLFLSYISIFFFLWIFFFSNFQNSFSSFFLLLYYIYFFFFHSPLVVDVTHKTGFC